MVCLDRRYEDIIGLQKLLNDVERGDLIYNGTSRADLEEFFYEVKKNPEGAEYPDLIHACELSIDYSLGEVIKSEGNLMMQLEYYKKRKVYLNLMDELHEDQWDIKGLIQLILEGRK